MKKAAKILNKALVEMGDCINTDQIIQLLIISIDLYMIDRHTARIECIVNDSHIKITRKQLKKGEGASYATQATFSPTLH